MPIYEYRRPDGTTFEVQQSFSDPALTVDPDSGVPVERVLHPPAVHFKGKGFYNTDYGTRSRQREAAESGASEKAGEGDSSAADKSAAARKDGKDGKDGKDSKPSAAKDAKPVAAAGKQE